MELSKTPRDEVASGVAAEGGVTLGQRRHRLFCGCFHHRDLEDVHVKVGDFPSPMTIHGYAIRGVLDWLLHGGG